MPYKVVTKDRKSCVVMAEEYVRDYFKDEIVEARPDTLGIMTFRLKRQAKEFMGHLPEWMILKVKGIGRGAKPKEIANNVSHSTLNLFYGRLKWRPPHLVSPPNGTICYQSIKVLE